MDFFVQRSEVKSVILSQLKSFELFVNPVR